MIFQANNKQIDIYDYYVTNACVLQFINVEDDQDIKSFFYNLGELNRFDIVDDKAKKIIDSRSMDLVFDHYTVENTYITETTTEVVEEAWDEPIETQSENSDDGEESEQAVIHHDAVTISVEKQVPVEMTSVFLEAPNVEKEISMIKEQVSDMSSSFSTAIPNTKQLQSLFSIQVASLTDEQALTVSDFFEVWEDIPDGIELVKDKRVKYREDGLLYKVAQTHKKQADWNPTTASLFTVIEPSHAGTKEDPIPAHANMEYVQGKYYVEDGVIYLCNSDIAKDGVVLQYVPSQLIDVYFEKVEEGK